MLPALDSLLFVPGSRPDRFARAGAAGASLVCIDLEDSVPAADKAAARDAALAAPGLATMAVRINGLRTRAGLADLVALGTAAVRPAAVLLPMAEAAAEVEIVRGALGDGVAIIALVETVRGLDAGAAIAGAGVAAIMLGGVDLAAQLGVAVAWEPLALARARLVMACAGAGVAAIDMPWIGLDDVAGLADEAARARVLGFTGKAAIHPDQVATINAAFAPSAAEVAAARAATAAFAAGGGAAVRFAGQMLEAPLMARHARVLARAEPPKS